MTMTVPLRGPTSNPKFFPVTLHASPTSDCTTEVLVVTFRGWGRRPVPRESRVLPGSHRPDPSPDEEPGVRSVPHKGPLWAQGRDFVVDVLFFPLFYFV